MCKHKVVLERAPDADYQFEGKLLLVEAIVATCLRCGTKWRRGFLAMEQVLNDSVHSDHRGVVGHGVDTLIVCGPYAGLCGP